MIEDWKYQISLALPEGTPDGAISTIYDIVEAALKDRDERHYRLLCEWCGDPAYDLRWHHDEWRHYRLRDMHVELCDAAVLRGSGKD